MLKNGLNIVDNKSVIKSIFLPPWLSWTWFIPACYDDFLLNRTGNVTELVCCRRLEAADVDKEQNLAKGQKADWKQTNPIRNQSKRTWWCLYLWQSHCLSCAADFNIPSCYTFFPNRWTFGMSRPGRWCFVTDCRHTVGGTIFLIWFASWILMLSVRAHVFVCTFFLFTLHISSNAWL